MQCTVYNINCTRSLLLSTMYTVHFTVYIVHFKLYIIHYTFNDVHCKLYTVHCTLPSGMLETEGMEHAPSSNLTHQQQDVFKTLENFRRGVKQD